MTAGEAAGGDAAGGDAGTSSRRWRDCLAVAAERLASEREARLLVEEVSGLTASELVLGASMTAGPPALRRLEQLVGRRLAGEPLQHVLGHWGFRQLDLLVGPDALVPRPETEVVVEVALAELGRLEGCRAVDLGTGTGAIGISIAVEAPGCEVVATDLSEPALRLARANLAGVGRRAGARVTIVHGDWYAALPTSLVGSIDVVVSNPPYVAESEWVELDPVVKLYDPRRALVAGPSGLEDVERVVRGAGPWLARRAAVVVEIAPHQARAAQECARGAGFDDVEVLPDLAGRERVLVARR